MRRIRAGINNMYYCDRGGKYLNEGDTVAYNSVLYKVIASDDKVYLGIAKDESDNLIGFSEESLTSIKKISLTKEEENVWKDMNFAPVSREKLAV